VIAGLEQSRREESPDTVVVGSEEPVTNTLQPLNRGFRVKGNAPGNARGRPRRLRRRAEFPASGGGVELSSARCGSVTESATENIPPAEQHGGIAQGNLRDVFEKAGLRSGQAESFGKGEKVG
jgi:hypothetical protein